MSRPALPHHYTGKVRDLYEVSHDRMLIVASDRIQEMETLPNHEFRVRLLDGTELRASRTYSSAFENLLK